MSGKIGLVLVVIFSLQSVRNNISVNDAGEHIKINNFLLTAPKILILGSTNRA